MVISCMAIQDTCFTSTSGRLEKCTRRLQFSTICTKWTEIWLRDSDHITSRSYYISLYWIIYCYLNMTCLIYDDTLFHLVLACVCFAMAEILPPAKTLNCLVLCRWSCSVLRLKPVGECRHQGSRTTGSVENQIETQFCGNLGRREPAGVD
jgi:hypothetical protein